MPVAVPGAAVSPGTNNCIFANAPAFTVMDGLVFGDLVPSVASEAVSVWVPTVLKVTLKDCDPATRAVPAGKVALASVEEMLEAAQVWQWNPHTNQPQPFATLIARNVPPAEPARTLP